MGQVCKMSLRHRPPSPLFRALPLLALLLAFAASAEGLDAAARAAIDSAAAEVLARSGAPSISLSIVEGGKVVYEQAYGTADLEAKLPASPSHRYSIGSVSKQFTAAAVLLLCEEGKLSLDDKVVRFLPELSRAKDVTVRQLLSMTAGYQDFWPQDYVMPMMREPASVQRILDGWAKRPLDFEPGSKWQYSNTNYVIAGAIVEKAAQQPLVAFLQERIFSRLGMASIKDTDQQALGPGEPRGYLRHGLGPPRPAPKEGAGWMFAAGELAMTAHDLSLWNLSLLEQSILQPASYRLLETPVPLASGVTTGYALGLSAALKDGRRVLSHDGEVSGFTAQSSVYPEEKAAIAVLVNLDASPAAGQLAGKIAGQLFASRDAAAAAALERAKGLFAGLQKGKLDRTLLTANASDYFSAQALADLQETLGRLGAPKSFTQASSSLRGGMVKRRFLLKFQERQLALVTFWMPDGLVEQLIVEPEE
jgi:D-alanyl-D-alanine carboxypeptidase